MAEQNLVVARYQNGNVIKGTTQDFYPDRPVFHVVPRAGAPAVAIKIAELKAVFFVKDLIGNRTRVKPRKFQAVDPTAQGKKIAVLFADGELIVGHTLVYSPGRQGFFLFPADPLGNNLRIYVVVAAARTVKVGPAAEELALTAPKPKPKAPRAA